MHGFLEPTGNNWGLYVESQIRLSCSSQILAQGRCKQKVLPNSLRMNQCNAQNRCRGLNAENDVDKVFIHKCLENFHFFQLKTPPSNPIQSNPTLCLSSLAIVVMMVWCWQLAGSEEEEEKQEENDLVVSTVEPHQHYSGTTKRCKRTAVEWGLYSSTKYTLLPLVLFHSAVSV